MATSLTHQYIPRIEQTEENIFLEEYYSSTDTKIYIDGVEQSEIGYISYALQEQLKPIYGYSSMTFDDVAIGQRIVTGVFKMPIRNTEANATRDDVMERSTNSNYEYNNAENESIDFIEWINKQDSNDDKNNISGNDSSDYSESDVDYEYRSKLIALGYDLDYNSSNDSLERAIKKFQRDHKMDETGKLGSYEKEKINKEFEKKTYDIINVPPNTKLYTMPIFGADYVLLSSQSVYVIDRKFDDGWVYVMTSSGGTEGFINIS